jgi:hypothetical protein
MIVGVLADVSVSAYLIDAIIGLAGFFPFDM